MAKVVSSGRGRRHARSLAAMGKIVFVVKTYGQSQHRDRQGDAEGTRYFTHIFH